MPALQAGSRNEPHGTYCNDAFAYGDPDPLELTNMRGRLSTRLAGSPPPALETASAARARRLAQSLLPCLTAGTPAGGEQLSADDIQQLLIPPSDFCPPRAGPLHILIAAQPCHEISRDIWCAAEQSFDKWGRAVAVEDLAVDTGAIAAWLAHVAEHKPLQDWGQFILGDRR